MGRAWLGLWAFLLVAVCVAGEPNRCNNLPGSAAELAATPRDDENLEMLAIELSPGVTAVQAIYDRLKRDVAAIHALEPRVHAVTYWEPYDGSLLVSLDPASMLLVQRGQYHAWDCLNRHYGGSLGWVGRSWVLIRFKGRYNGRLLAKPYVALPGVTSVDLNTRTTVSTPANIYVTREEGSWHYLFDNRCPACNEPQPDRAVYYFRVSDDGVAEATTK